MREGEQKHRALSLASASTALVALVASTQRAALELPGPERRAMTPTTSIRGKRHGSRSAYVSGCRCEVCLAANRTYQAEWRARNYAKVMEQQRANRKRYGGRCEDCGKPTDGSNGHAKAPKKCLKCYNAARRPEHGTKSRYEGGCRCDDCRRANAEAQRAWRARQKALA